MIDAIAAYVDERRLRRGGGTVAGGAIVVGKDAHPAAKVTLILFDDRGRPAAVAKVARQPGGEAALTAEHDMLDALWSAGFDRVTPCIPEPLGLDRIQGRLVLVVTPVPGEPLVTRYYSPGHVSDPKLVEQDFALAGSWLDRLHEETRSNIVTFDDDAFDRWVTCVFERYRRTIGWGPAEDRIVTEVTRRAKDLHGCSIPVTVAHGDYSIGNVLVEGARVSGVVDWEMGSMAELPFRDVYKFPTSYGLYLDRAWSAVGGSVPGHAGRAEFGAWRRYGTWRSLTGFAYSYFGRGWFPTLVRRYIVARLDHLGVPHAVNSVFFPVFLAQQAMAIADPGFRDGYRAALHGFEQEAGSTWLSAEEVAS